jgi:hypothetical protein
MPNYDPEYASRIIEQGRALVHAVESLTTIEPTGPIECLIVGLLLPAYKRRLREIVESVPNWVREEILSASEHIGDERAVLWSDN